MVVYHQCQCSLFKQFTTKQVCCILFEQLFIINVNVLFLSNSQRTPSTIFVLWVVYHQCQCSLFKQFTTHSKYNFVLWVVYHQCQCSLFKQFTTASQLISTGFKLFIINVNVLFLSNSQLFVVMDLFFPVVYHQCQCSLFKQFTTKTQNLYNYTSCLSSMSMFSF